jgi:hypothetical protein
LVVDSPPPSKHWWRMRDQTPIDPWGQKGVAGGDGPSEGSPPMSSRRWWRGSSDSSMTGPHTREHRSWRLHFDRKGERGQAGAVSRVPILIQTPMRWGWTTGQVAAYLTTGETLWMSQGQLIDASWDGTACQANNYTQARYAGPKTAIKEDPPPS